MLNRTNTLLLLLLPVFSLFSQSYEQFQDLKSKFHDQKKVFISRGSKIELFFNKNDELNARVTRSSVEMLLKNLPSAYANESISYSTWQQGIEELSATCYIPDGEKYEKKKIKEFLTKDELSAQIFHQGISSKNFTYPSTQAGTVYEMSYVTLLENPRFLPMLYTASYSTILDLEVELIYPEDIKVDIDFFQLDKNSYTIKEEKKGKKVVTKITRKNVPELEYYSSSPSFRHICPQISIRVNSIRGKSYLSDVTDLHDFYKEWVKDVDADTDEDLKHLVDSLIIDKTTEFDKVKTIYYWVQSNIKYVAFEKGDAGFVPAQPSQVCSSRFGDCKGMSGLTYRMLSLAGVDAHLTWIGSRDIPYGYSELPTPSVDNHMIATYIDGDNYYFLDATGSNVPIDQTTAFIQGKEALIHKGDDYEVYKVPIQSYEKNKIKDSVDLEIVDNDIKGSGQVTITGLYRNYFRNVVQRNTDEQNKLFLESVLEKGSNKFKLDDFEIVNLLDRDKPLIVKYTFVIPDYVKIRDNNYYVNLNLNDIEFGEPLEEERTVPFEIDISGTYQFISSLKYDETKYEINSIPEIKKYDHELFGFINEYSSSQKGMITNEFVSFENFLLLEKPYFEERNLMTKEARRSFNQTLSLKLK